LLPEFKKQSKVMAPSARPDVLLLCLEMQSFFDQQYATFIDNLDRSANIKRAKGATGVLRYLEANNPKVITRNSGTSNFTYSVYPGSSGNGPSFEREATLCCSRKD
jgi:hypothetical protein